MPIYEYQCQTCGHQFEVTQRITESPLKDCPACNKPELARLISATSFTLKGGGWYKDGYGSSKQRTENQVSDRLTKAINDDKKKTAEGAETSETSSSSSSESVSSSSSGGSAGSSAGSS